jgi:hypothetical protein
MKKSYKIAIGAAVLCGAVALSVWAHSITAVTMSIGMPNQTVQLAGNPKGSVVNVTSDVCTGDDLSFTVTFGTDTQGDSTTFPMNAVPFTVAKTAGAQLLGALSPTAFNVDFTSATTISPSTKAITMTAPSTASLAGDPYTVKVDSPGLTIGTGKTQNKLLGGSLVINFTVKDCTPPCVPATTSIAVDSFCVTLHQTDTINLTATLTSGGTPGTPVAGQTLHLSVPDASFTGDAQTDVNGVATIPNFNVSGLSVGDHEVDVSFDGVACPATPAYAASSSQGSIGVKYGAVSFLQPINADNSSIFKGGVIPVKIRVYDANMQIVSDAMPYVFLDYAGGNILGADAEPLANTNGDNGNLMRWDPVGQLYILNWDINGADIANGTYRLYIDLGEGTCGEAHSVCLSIQKVGKGVKR